MTIADAWPPGWRPSSTRSAAVGQAVEEDRVGVSGEGEGVVGGEVVAVEAHHPGQAVAGGVEGQGLAVAGRSVERVGGEVPQGQINVRRGGEQLGHDGGGDPSVAETSAPRAQSGVRRAPA